MNAPPGEVAFNGWSRQQRVHHTQSLLHTMPKPIIAAVNGAASGLGADTALACDFIIASERASFTWSYINRGIIPDGGGMYFLPRRVGLRQGQGADLHRPQGRGRRGARARHRRSQDGRRRAAVRPRRPGPPSWRRARRPRSRWARPS